MDTHFTVSLEQQAELMSVLRSLPAILTGRTVDPYGIGEGFRARIGHATLGLILENFERLSRGEPGADGEKWPDLSKEYLAYQRSQNEKRDLLKGAGLSGKKHNKGPGATKGLLTQSQLQLWRKTFSDRFAWYVMSEPDEAARAHAAAIAWIVVKKAGGKTKLEVFGNRKVQILVDTGYLRGSLTPGTLTEQGPNAIYTPPPIFGGLDQVFEYQAPYQIIVGTNVKYAKYHHGDEGQGYRPLWPSSFPDDWWNQILGVSITGLQRISEVFRI